LGDLRGKSPPFLPFRQGFCRKETEGPYEASWILHNVKGAHLPQNASTKGTRRLFPLIHRLHC
jgi:hypothetical protein